MTILRFNDYDNISEKKVTKKVKEVVTKKVKPKDDAFNIPKKIEKTKKKSEVVQKPTFDINQLEDYKLDGYQSEVDKELSNLETNENYEDIDVDSLIKNHGIDNIFNNMDRLEKMRSELEIEEANEFEPDDLDIDMDSLLNDYKKLKENENLYSGVTEVELDDNLDNELEVEDSENYNDNQEEDYYELYVDKSEKFKCDISINGADETKTEPRLIIETGEWNLLFRGQVIDGKCIIPIKKINLLKEGDVGTIKLEVNADGTLITPWEKKFIMKKVVKVKRGN